MITFLITTKATKTALNFMSKIFNKIKKAQPMKVIYINNIIYLTLNK